MPKVSDIKDPTFRKALAEVDKLLDAGEYTKAALQCADAYIALLNQRPELAPPPPAPGGHGGPAAFDPGAFAAGRAVRRASWPVTGGIRIQVGEDRRPTLAFDKQRFSLSEAATYFEFTVEQLVRAQEEET